MTRETRERLLLLAAGASLTLAALRLLGPRERRRPAAGPGEEPEPAPGGAPRPETPKNARPSVPQPAWKSFGDGLMDDDPDARDNYCENNQLRDLLDGIGYTHGVDLWHWWEPNAPHNEAAWADRVGRPLELFAGMTP